jgi:hypothetical protein
MHNLDIKIIRYDESNTNVEALKGQYAQYGDKNATFTILKNLLFINLHANCKYDEVKLPTVFDGFIQLSNGQRINITDSTLKCSLDSTTTGFGVLVLKKWN